MTTQLAIDTWSGPTIERTVVVAPDGAHVAIQEVDSTTNSPVQRVRVLTMTGRVAWIASNLPLVTAMAWSSDGTELALGSIPSPWTVVILTANGHADATTYDVPGPHAYALIGFAPDNARLIG